MKASFSQVDSDGLPILSYLKASLLISSDDLYILLVDEQIWDIFGYL